MVGVFEDAHFSFFGSSTGVPTSRFITEGEYVEITAITKEQSGVYECMSTNYVSAPDVKIVRVTVNCKL